MEIEPFRDPVARALFRECADQYEADGVDWPDLVDMAESTINRAWILIAARGELGAEPDPEWLFRGATESSELAEYLASARADGVTDQEIRSWHGLPYLRRSVYQYEWEVYNCGDPFDDECETGYQEKSVIERSPVFRCPTDPPNPRYDVAPLPAEIYPRYLAWRARCRLPLERLEFRVVQSGTYNAYLRSEIKAGRM